ncbi:MAG: AbrB/MazE/SpoVT family DNA-binding domain-containing protein [Candidatus Korarchaeota archaeon]|nr:AbrB/MazE/SpoVT family DNA-binding domain-containing protein [Candidatus Korarchaeota archaeon]
MLEEATVTSKGQITIPKKIRERLGLKPGTKVTFLLRGKEALMIPKPKDPLEELEKLRKDIHFTAEEIEALLQEAKEKWSKAQLP